MKSTFPKSERLRSQHLIDRIFERGNFSLHIAPFRFSFTEVTGTAPSPCQVLITVSKKNFKTAVGRNRIRRQIRELYRLNKQELIRILEKNKKQIAFLISYSSKNDLNYKEVEPLFTQALKRISNELDKMDAATFSAADKGL